MSVDDKFARIEAAVERALEELRAGRPVLVTDDESRENEGDVILAAGLASTQWLAWTIRHSSGYLCAPLTNAYADRLGLPLMVADNADPLRTAYTVSVDARDGVTTGISAADRAHTARVLADPATTAADLIRPGHVIPLRAKDGGVLERRGHTEAGVDLCRLAGLPPVAVIGELVHDDGTMMRRPAVVDLATRAGLAVLTIEQLAQWRTVHDRVERLSAPKLPTDHGVFTMQGYRDKLTGTEHLALVSPRGLGNGAPLVRVHSECLTGDAFGSRRCDCGPQLQASLAKVAASGGAVIYLRGHEGRGVGLASKLAAYVEQDNGADTVEAQERLGLPVDDREFGAAAAILADLGLQRIRLLTNNPAKVVGLRALGVDVAAQERLVVGVTETNLGYLRTKRDRLGHDLVLEHTDRGETA